MRRILQLFLTRVLYVALLILAVTAIHGAFPLGPKQSGLLSLFAVGIPTVALAAWARPVTTPTTGLLRSTLRFAVPAASTLAVAGVTVYLGYLLPEPQAAQRRAIAHTALTVLSVLSGLLLIVLAEPAVPGAAAPPRHTVAGADRRPALLALALFLAFVAIMALPDARAFFELQALDPLDYALIGLAAAAWALVVRWMWRTRLLDRIVGTRPTQDRHAA